MKQTSRLLIVAACMLLCPMLAQAQESLTVHVEEAGTLQEQAEAAGLSEDITALTITGELNGTDIKFLRGLLHSYKSETAYPDLAIMSLDISGVRIVSGGESYARTGNNYWTMRDLYTEDDVLGEEMFEGAQHLQSINLPMGLKSIGKYALCMIPVKNVTIHEGVLYLGYAAIGGTAIEEIVLPSTLQMVGTYCFSECKHLKRVVIAYSYMPPAFGFKAFDGVNYDEVELQLASVWDYGLEMAMNNFSEADGWKNFTNITTLLMDETGVEDVYAHRPAPTDNRYYRLDGTEANPPGKGVYIHNGQKVVVK